MSFASTHARLAALTLLAGLLPALAWGQPATQGRWSAPFEMGGIAVHLGLLRGPGDSDRVMWWSGFEGNQIQSWTYRPGPFDPATSFLAKSSAPTPGNFYESGFSPLADGRLLSVGGIVTYHNDGSDRLTLFDPLDSTCTPGARPGVARFEPSTTALPDGRILISGGVRYTYAITSGGRRPKAGAPGTFEALHDMHPLITHQTPVWGDSIDEAWGSARRPPSMELASAVGDPGGNYRMLLFGGHDATTPTGDVVFGEVWQLQRDDRNDTAQVVWTWDTLATVAADAQSGRPVARYGHAAVITGDRRMIVFGGRDATHAFDDVWALDLTPAFPAKASWSHWTPAPDPTFGLPAARWGHAAVYDAALGRMLVFGGRDSAGLRADDAWALSLGPSPAWTRLAPSGQPREGHSAVLGLVPYPRVWVFGGRGGSGLRSDLMEYRLDTGTWRGPLALAPGSPVPAPRADHAALYESQSNQLLVSGGELAGGAIDDGLWRIALVPPSSETTSLTWQQSPASPEGPGPRAGHRFVYEDDPVLARRFEVYDPAGSTAGLPGVVSALPASARRWVYFYPPMFVLPSGHVFFALGNPTGVLDWRAGTWSTIGGAPDGGTVGGAVQYRPGRIMRCGGFYKQGMTETIAFDAADGTAGWSTWTLGGLNPRLLPRLTLLPTGDVLASGGIRAVGDPLGVRVPQLWNDTSGWTDSTLLAPEPVFRNYHSTAILLPDGRVFTAGGSFGPNQTQGCIYEPPYLFDAQGALAPQPVLTGVPGTAAYGQTLAVGTADSTDAARVTSMCLIKPSVTTHDVNFEQRFVPLDFTHATGALHVSMPVTANLAPPGDYLLFAIETMDGAQGAREVPSIARWVRLAGPDSTTGAGATPFLGEDRARLLPPAPSPARGRVTLGFTLPARAEGRLEVFDLSGRRVCVLADGTLSAGRHELVWDGRGKGGRSAPNGLYFVRLASLGRAATTRLILAR